MSEAFVCAAVRTPIGRYGGALAALRPDDLGALPVRELTRRHPAVDWERVDDVIYGCANQAGEDNRNVARMSALLAGLPEAVPGTTVNRLCGSGMDAVGLAARSIRAGDADLMIAGGVESMSRAPFVLAKAERAFDRGVSMHDTTIGWRFVNPALRERVGTHSMPETADNVAADFGVSREDQDRFALRSQERWAAANAAGHFREEIVPVSVAAAQGRARRRRHRRAPSRDGRSRRSRSSPASTVRGRASPPATPRGVNDGACALIVASEAAAARHGLEPRARIVAMASAGVAPRIYGHGTGAPRRGACSSAPGSRSGRWTSSS